MIEIYDHQEEGYTPFLIREGWQVAQLNHIEKHGFSDMDTLEVHQRTDEVFILLHGTAVLIAADRMGSEILYEAINMQRGVTYNIPAGVWHNIAMDKDAAIIIVEKSDTHIEDCTLFLLTELQKKELCDVVKRVL